MILLLVALLERDRGLSPILLGAIGVWWICVDIGRIFPGVFMRQYYRRVYQKFGIDRTKYLASIDDRVLQVEGENASWRVRWQEVSPKGEDPEVFMFHARGTMFIFAKRYLAEEQQRQLRSFSGL